MIDILELTEDDIGREVFYISKYNNIKYIGEIVDYNYDIIRVKYYIVPIYCDIRINANNGISVYYKDLEFVKPVEIISRWDLMILDD